MSVSPRMFFLLMSRLAFSPSLRALSFKRFSDQIFLPVSDMKIAYITDPELFLNSRGMPVSSCCSSAGGVVLQTSAKAGRARKRNMIAANTGIFFIRSLLSLLFCNVISLCSIGKIACLSYYFLGYYR